MKWNTLYHKLGDFPARKLFGQAYVLVENPHTGRMDRVYPGAFGTERSCLQDEIP